ncbi:MAG: hypothetical protein V4722_05515 [Bacteroidota bacterium]
MNFEFAEQINPSLTNLDFGKAISIAENSLRKIPQTEFHSIIGKSLLHQTDSLVSWIEHFHKTLSLECEIKALYFEMNEFDINTDVWYIDGFGFEKDGGLDSDMEWLCDVYGDKMTGQEFVLSGYEQQQNAFESIELDSDHLQDSRDWCEQLIIARFMELMFCAHSDSKKKGLGWATIPLYYTEYSYDFILRS